MTETQNDTSTHAAEIGVLSVRRLMYDRVLACRVCGRGLYEHDTMVFQWMEKP